MASDTGVPQQIGPVQIVKINEDSEGEGMFVLDEEALRSVLDNIPSGMKISVVSVVGAFRTGKSFLLNLFLRYLRCMRDAKRESFVQKSVQKVSGRSRGWLSDSVEGPWFESKRSEDRVTTGIWLWYESFSVVTEADGQEVAVLLMDTQGLFDTHVSANVTERIFALSALMSTCIVYNMSGRINDFNIAHLAAFAEAARGAHAEHDAGAADTRPLHTLQLLVRDFQDFNLDAPMPELRNRIEKYIEGSLEKAAHEGKDGVRSIRSCFESVGGWVLPHPGSRVTKAACSVGADLQSVLDPDFPPLADEFVRGILTGQLAVHMEAGQPMTRDGFVAHVVEYGKLFNKADTVSPVEQALKARQRINSERAVPIAVGFYKRCTTERSREAENGWVEDVVLAAGDSADREEARARLDRMLQGADDKPFSELEAQLEKAWKSRSDLNKLAKEVAESAHVDRLLEKIRADLLGRFVEAVAIADLKAAYKKLEDAALEELSAVFSGESAQDSVKARLKSAYDEAVVRNVPRVQAHNAAKRGRAAGRFRAFARRLTEPGKPFLWPPDYNARLQDKAAEVKERFVDEAIDAKVEDQLLVDRLYNVADDRSAGAIHTRNNDNCTAADWAQFVGGVGAVGVFGAGVGVLYGVFGGAAAAAAMYGEATFAASGAAAFGRAVYRITGLGGPNLGKRRAA